jgi:sulfoxide reductase catalytic subunit YedY
MLIKKPNDIPSSEVTSKSTYMNRRRFMTGALVTGAAVAGGLYLRKSDDGQVSTPGSVEASGEKLSGIVKSQYSTTEKPTSLKDITNYTNYYEFSTDK